jgi:hypothetical protein
MKSRLDFEHQTIDTTPFSLSWGDGDEPGYDAWGAVTVGDFDGDGRDEYATGGRLAPEGGYYHIYDRSESGEWMRHELTVSFRPAVGAASAHLDSDGRPEIVCGEWGSRLFALDASLGSPTFGSATVVYDGFENGPHDVLAADIDGDGNEEIITRVKDHSLTVFNDPSLDGEWEPLTIARDLEGDGTAVGNLSAGPGLDIVTNQGWFENTDGTGTQWRRHPLVSEELDWDLETRIAVGDVDHDGVDEVVITESELGANARLAVLSRTDEGPWDAEILVDSEEDRRAMHSLQIADLDGDGRLEIFTGEMENGKTDGVDVRPQWLTFQYRNGEWHRTVLLDDNVGTHCARVLDVDNDGRPDIVGKVWRANDVNAVDGLNHVDCLHNISAR